MDSCLTECSVEWAGCFGETQVSFQALYIFLARLCLSAATLFGFISEVTYSLTHLYHKPPRLQEKGGVRFFPGLFISASRLYPRELQTVFACACGLMYVNFQLSEVRTLVCSGHSDVLMFWPLFSSVWWQLYCTVSVDPSCLKHT